MIKWVDGGIRMDFMLCAMINVTLLDTYMDDYVHKLVKIEA